MINYLILHLLFIVYALNTVLGRMAAPPTAGRTGAGSPCWPACCSYWEFMRRDGRSC